MTSYETYIETYIMGLEGVESKRNFTGENYSAGVSTTYGNIETSKTNRDNNRTDRTAAEIDGGETTDGTIKYYTSQTELDADTDFTGTKLLTKESLHISGRNLETNTTEVARQAARVSERGTYDPGTDTYAGDTGTEKEREDARILESGTTEVARQAARIAERGSYDPGTDTYAGDTGTEKEREDARILESGTTEVARQAARVAERGTYDPGTDTYLGDTGTEKNRQDARVAERGTYDPGTDTYLGDTGTEKKREDARIAEAIKETQRELYRNREDNDENIVPWDPDNATNNYFRNYINFPENSA